MPLVRISVGEKRSAAEMKAIGEGIYQAMISTIKVPANDRFQIITPYPEERLVYDKSYLGIERGSGFVLIQIFLNAGRTVEMKKAFYKAIADNLEKDPGVKPADVFITLVEVPKENWSFGNGIAQYADP